ncbi:MAG: tetratricopeptide repeat protein [Gallionella sp.]|jgi:Flp pilus assembly protein TadD
MTAPDITDAQTLFFQGCDLMEAGNFSDAEDCFEKAMQIAPDFAAACANLGWLIEKRGDTRAAEACYRRSIALNPGHSETHLDLGALLANAKRFDEAEACYKRAIDLKPHGPEAWSNLGVLYACLKRETEAERCHRTAIFLDASYDMARFNLSYLLLSQGRFEEGWSCLDARNWYQGIAEYLTMPRWKGEALAGKSLLIVYEAGLGDMIQFCRYAALLKDQGTASITLLCHPPLKTLLANVDGVDEIIGYDEAFPASGWDYWTPLLSIPGYCNTRLESIPAKIPYLHAQPDLIDKWAALIPIKGLRVGLVWKGNPLFENDADRSLSSLDVLAPLWNVQGVTFISLQKGEGENESPPDGHSLIRPGPQDFADTAAILANLDLVISVDTAVAHLAGALGKRCWTLLPEYKTDWRWLKERTDTPWYPGVMRLYRQETMGDWAPVIARVVHDLEQLAQER